MGKGDRKTAKGKRFNSSYGNVRSKVLTKLVKPADSAASRTAVAKKSAPARSAAGAGKKVVRKTAA